MIGVARKRLMAVWSSTTERKTPRLHAAADDPAFEHVEGGEEGRGAVADIVVGHGAAAPLLDREPWLGAVERLDLAHMGNSQVKTFGSGRFRLSWQISVGCFVSKV